MKKALGAPQEEVGGSSGSDSGSHGSVVLLTDTFWLCLDSKISKSSDFPAVFSKYPFKPKMAKSPDYSNTTLALRRSLEEGGRWAEDGAVGHGH